MATAQELWEKAKPLVRRRMSFTPDLWRSVEAAVPVTIDGTTFVLGLAPENEPLRSHLETNTMTALIREILRELTGTEMQVVILIGTTEEDWQRYKARQEQIRQLTTRTAEVTTRKAKERDWSWLIHQFDQDHAHLPHRQYDFVKAGFLLNCAQKAAEFALDYLAHHPDRKDEVTRELERVCQRLAGMLNAPAIVVGMEIERALRERQKRDGTAQEG
ncbi:MAG: hypothetical protein SLRJCFUN_000061 [Candidatus Fervidibacter sp.]